jgi:hypothetical protein
MTGYPYYDGSSMRLVGQLSNPSPSLRAIFAALPDGSLEPTTGPYRPGIPAPVARRLGNGVVQRAVVKVLAAARRPLTVLEAQAAVANLLGHPVSKGSINYCLSTGTLGREPRFERVARGCYQLRRDWPPT